MGCHALLQGSSPPRDRTRVSYISYAGRQFSTTSAPGKPHSRMSSFSNDSQVSLPPSIHIFVYPLLLRMAWTYLFTSGKDIGDMGSISGSGRSPGEEHGNPLQCSCLENSMDRGAWQTTVHGVAEPDTTELLTHTHTRGLRVAHTSGKW